MEMNRAETVGSAVAAGAEPSVGATWRLQWEYGTAEVQALGAMLGPVTFKLDSQRTLQVMQLAAWADDDRAADLPGVLRRLRGEWPCLPFGRTDAPGDLPSGWELQAAEDDWPHGYGANHAWSCEYADEGLVALSLVYPSSSPIERVERRLKVVPDEPALELSFSVHARRPVVLPVGLHPTFRLPRAVGRMWVELGAHDGVYTYPNRGAGSVSRLLPDQRAAGLEVLPGMDGDMDLSRLPLAQDCEELLQVRGLRAAGDAAALRLHYLDEDASVGLWWDTAQLPDLMLWVSNRGRREYPWQGQHLALGAEPVNSVFDLARVARPPAGHPLADRQGIQLTPAQPWTTHYRMAARSACPTIDG
ncbi:hypothetical protein [Roseateles sp.]|uniref:hypothetical protein n=1 Tax=Roseateles sp. TaxID=1971397 RepID=UPI0039EA0405